MALSDFKNSLLGVEIKCGDDGFVVYGLSWSILEPIIHEFWDDISAIVEKLGGEDEPDFMEEITGLIRRLPELEARIIAEAAHEPNMTGTVKCLPLPIRVEALQEIARLTFVDLEHAKKMVTTLTEAWEAAQQLLPGQASPVGSEQ